MSRLERSFSPGDFMGDNPPKNKRKLVPSDHRVPRRRVHFPDKVLKVSRERILSSAEFLALPHTDVNKAEPVLVQTEDGGEIQKAFLISNRSIAVIVPFETLVGEDGGVNVTRASYPLSSPNKKHAYMDEAQLMQALTHGAYRQAMRLHSQACVEEQRRADFNAGYNRPQFPEPPVPPIAHHNDKYF